MRECLKCGYMDIPIWRKMSFTRFTDMCRIEDLKEWEPKLAKTIESYGLKVCQIGNYRYRLSKDGIVKRIHASDCQYPNKLSIREPPMEKVKQKLTIPKVQMILSINTKRNEDSSSR